MRATPGDIERVFPWTAATRVSDKGGKITTPDDTHAAQAFFGLPRRIRLVFGVNVDKHPCDLLGIVDDVIVTGYITRPWGTNYTAWSRGHPLSPYYRMKENDIEFLPLHLQSSRVGYRQWLGMVMKDPKRLRLPAQCLAEFEQRSRELNKDEAAVYRRSRLLVAGYAMDNMKPLDFAEALLPLIITGSEAADEAIKKLAHDWVSAADSVASQVVSAVNRALYGEAGKADRDSTVLEAVKSRFWADTENEFYDHLRKAAENIEAQADTDQHGELQRQASANWLVALKKHALIIFDDTVPIEDADSDRIEDVIAGRRMLVLALTGYGPVGKDVFARLNQPPVESKAKKGRKAA
jgi:CRISPR system Cascade subunit CasA